MYNSFAEMMLESSVKDIMATEFKKVPFQITETPDEIQLIIFVIPFKGRRQGKATEFLQRLKELAQQENKNLVLNADDGYLTDPTDMNLSQLKQFYKKLGFTKNRGKFQYIWRSDV